MIKPSEILMDLFPVIEKKVLTEFVQDSRFQSEFAEQFRKFFTDLVQAIDSNDFSCLDSTLQTWSNSLTQSDLEEDKLVVNEFLNQLVLLVHQTIIENTAQGNLDLISTTMFPAYIYIFNKTAVIEYNEKLKYMTKQVEQAKIDLSKLDESKSNFVAVAAHELKTPLTLIDGYTSMLLDTILKQNNNDLLVFVNGILNGSKRLRGIIEDMIDVSMVENNLLRINYQPFWLNRIIEFVMLDFVSVIKERDIQVEIQDFDGFEDLNYGDSERLIQLFTNLLSNAIKFTPDGGKITIRGRKLSGFVDIIISDTGIGIDPKDQVTIFDKFNRLGNVALHSSGKTKFKGGGPGLGLSIAKGIAEAHGGSIWVESPGYSETDFPGSTFHVLLPVKNKIPDNLLVDEGKLNE